MKHELYEFSNLGKYVQGKIKEQLNKFLYNKKGRPICTKNTYEEDL